MEDVKQQYLQRAPRIGIEPEMLMQSGIDIAASPCVFRFKDGSTKQLEILSIVNISTSGIKLTMVNREGLALSDTQLHLVMKAPAVGKEYVLRGQVCWSENLTGGNSWIGIELKARPDVLHLFTALTGQKP